MNNRENVTIIVVLTVLLFITGYLYLAVNGNISPSTTENNYTQGLSASAVYSSSSSTVGSYNKAYYKIIPSTSYSYSTPIYYPSTTYLPSTQSSDCYISGYDQYGDTITTCKYFTP